MDEVSFFEESSDAEAAAMMSSLLDSLLNDFSYWINRGEELLTTCPDSVLDLEERNEMAAKLVEGRKAIVATRSLVSATPSAMAISMEAMAPWHQLVMEVWALGARISKANVRNTN